MDALTLATMVRIKGYPWGKRSSRLTPKKVTLELCCKLDDWALSF
jgi:hypothetical protein